MWLLADTDEIYCQLLVGGPTSCPPQHDGAKSEQDTLLNYANKQRTDAGIAA